MPTKKEYKKRKLKGFCSLCRSKAIEGKTICKVCSEKRKIKYHKVKKSKICVQCQKKLTVKNRTRCEDCANQQKNISLQRRKNRKEHQQCIRCGKKVKSGKSLCEYCLKEGKKIRDQRRKQGLCQRCGREVKSNQSKCERCKAYDKLSVDKLRDEVFSHYGGICQRCGEDNVLVLTIDHINNDGNAHRKKVFSSGVYRDLRKREFPNGYQVLCRNCNWLKYLEETFDIK